VGSSLAVACGAAPTPVVAVRGGPVAAGEVQGVRVVVVGAVGGAGWGVSVLRPWVRRGACGVRRGVSVLCGYAGGGAGVGGKRSERRRRFPDGRAASPGAFRWASPPGAALAARTAVVCGGCWGRGSPPAMEGGRWAQRVCRGPIKGSGAVRRVALVTVTYGGVKVEYHTEYEEGEEVASGSLVPAERAPRGEVGAAGQSYRSRAKEQWLLASLPWETVGDRLLMVTWTYPGDWRPWVPDGHVWNAHRRAMAERWRYRYGRDSLMGVWQKEFQRSGRPHLHAYVGCPAGVSGEDYEGLRQRTLLRKRLERAHGVHDGRGKLPPIGKQYGGEFGMWLRTAWAEVVGTQGVLTAHHARGVDVTVCFWSDAVARTKDRLEVVTYLAGESAKESQKVPPSDFPHVGRYYDSWQGDGSFVPREAEYEFPLDVTREIADRLVRLRRWRIVSERKRRGLDGAGKFDERRPDTGVMVTGQVRGEDFPRLVAWAEASAVRKRVRRASERSERAKSHFGNDRLRGGWGTADG